MSARDKPRRSRLSTTGSSTMATTHAKTTGTTTLAILKAMATRATTNSPTTEIRTAQFQLSTEIEHRRPWLRTSRAENVVQVAPGLDGPVGLRTAHDELAPFQ